MFCLAVVGAQHAALASSAPGIAALLVLVLGALLTPVWLAHVACTLVRRRLFRPRRSMTVVAGAAGAAGWAALVWAPGMSRHACIGVAVTAAAALCSGIADVAYDVVQGCGGANNEPLLPGPGADPE